MTEEDLFYGENASSTAKCKDGEIKFALAMLQRRRRVNKFNDEPNASEFNMTDYGVDEVRTFFDIVMGFKTLDQNKSLMVLPLIVQYDIADLLPKCVLHLKPITMKENVIHTLNVAYDVGCEELIDIVLDFLKLYGVQKLFMQEQYYLLLKPKSVTALLRIVVKNFFVLKNVVDWGEKYIEKHNIDIDLRTFFSKHLILNKLSVDCLESPESVLALYNIDSDKNIFTEKEIVKRLKELSVDKKECYQWKDIKKGENVRENFSLTYFVVIQNLVKVVVQFNPTIHELSQIGEKAEDNFFEVYVESNQWTESWQSNKLFNSSTCNILPAENTGSAKSQVTVTIKSEWGARYFKDVTVVYKFNRDCKILLSNVQLHPPWSITPSTEEMNVCERLLSSEPQKNFFTCGINFC